MGNTPARSRKKWAPPAQPQPKRTKNKGPCNIPIDKEEYKIVAATEQDSALSINDFIPNELLLFGYTRELEQNINVFNKMQTPIVIIHLIQSYFEIAFNYQYIFVAAISFTSPISTELIVHELETKQNLEINFDHQNNEQFWNVHVAAQSFPQLAQHETVSFCGISNISIPLWIQNKTKQNRTYFDQFDDKYNHYHAIASSDNHKCGLLAINTNILDRDITIDGTSTSNTHYGSPYYARQHNNALSVKAKWINLPVLRACNDNEVIKGTLIAKRYNLLYLGGVETKNKTNIHSKSIYLLNWSTDQQLQWKVLQNKLIKARCKPSGCLIYEKVGDIYKDMIGTQKIAIIGGYNIKTRNTLRSVELLSFENETKTTLLADMKYGRSQCGICTTNDTTRRIIVGGGNRFGFNDDASEFTTKSVELYDVNKDKWLFLPNFTRYPHRYKPSVWVLPSNPNIIYIAGDFRPDIRDMGHIEYCDVRDNKCYWHRHGDINFCKLQHLMRFTQIRSDYCPIQLTL